MVRTPDRQLLYSRLAAAGAGIEEQADGSLLVSGLEAAAIGELAAVSGAVLHELAPKEASLEEAFMELTEDSAEFRTGTGMGAGA